VNPPPGYSSRPVTRDDLDEIVELVHAIDLADVGLTDPVRDELLWDWATPGFRLDRDARLVVDDDGRIVGYADVLAHDPSIQVRSWLQLHPEHRSRAMAAAFLDWIESHARELSVSASGPVPLRHGAPATDGWTAALMGRRGFAHVRTFRQMRRPLERTEPDGVPIEGVSIRPSQRGRDDHAVHEVLDEAFREHFGYEPFGFDEWSAQWFGDASYDPGLVFLAFDGDRAVGVCQGIVIEGIGWIPELGVLGGWRRRGIGGSLLHVTFGELARRGIHEVRLGVDADNADHATHLYEAAGMTVRRAWHVYEKPIPAG
jgi:mycothiol synthase